MMEWHMNSTVFWLVSCVIFLYDRTITRDRPYTSSRVIYPKQRRNLINHLLHRYAVNQVYSIAGSQVTCVPEITLLWPSAFSRQKKQSTQTFLLSHLFVIASPINNYTY